MFEFELRPKQTSCLRGFSHQKQSGFGRIWCHEQMRTVKEVKNSRKSFCFCFDWLLFIVPRLFVRFLFDNFLVKVLRFVLLFACVAKQTFGWWIPNDDPWRQNKLFQFSSPFEERIHPSIQQMTKGVHRFDSVNSVAYILTSVGTKARPLGIIETMRFPIFPSSSCPLRYFALRSTRARVAEAENSRRFGK